MSRVVVAVGCSTYADYSFLVPLSALFWRSVVDYSPLLFLVGSEAEWLSDPRAAASLRAIRHHSVDHQFVELGGYPVGTVAQNARQHAAARQDIAGDDWVVMSDADLWPLRREFYRQVEQFPSARAVLLYSNGDHFQGKKDVLTKFDAGGGFQSIPTCHVAMRARDWRDVYDLTPGDVAGSTRRTLERMEPWLSRCPDQGLARWCCDQWYVTERLCRQEWFPYADPATGKTYSDENVLLVERRGHPPVDRLDRSLPNDWRGAVADKDRWTDCHVFKAPAEDAQWSLIYPVVEAYLPEYAAWARAYREDYMRSAK